MTKCPSASLITAVAKVLSEKEALVGVAEKAAPRRDFLKEWLGSFGRADWADAVREAGCATPEAIGALDDFEERLSKVKKRSTAITLKDVIAAQKPVDEPLTLNL